MRTWTAVGGLAAALGPVVGGLLVTASWRWVFLGVAAYLARFADDDVRLRELRRGRGDERVEGVDDFEVGQAEHLLRDGSEVGEERAEHRCGDGGADAGVMLADRAEGEELGVVAEMPGRGGEAVDDDDGLGFVAVAVDGDGPAHRPLASSR